MVNNFCSSINLYNGQQWTALAGMNELEVHANLHKCTNPGQPNGVVLSAATTIWLPIPPLNVFSFFRDERMRPQVHPKRPSKCAPSIHLNYCCYNSLMFVCFSLRSGTFFLITILFKRLHTLLMDLTQGIAYPFSG